MTSTFSNEITHNEHATKNVRFGVETTATPTDADVLVSVCGGWANHPGNKFLQSLLGKLFKQYDLALKNNETSISAVKVSFEEEIISITKDMQYRIRKSGGRFLTEENGVWEELSRLESYQWISDVLFKMFDRWVLDQYQRKQEEHERPIELELAPLRSDLPGSNNNLRGRDIPIHLFPSRRSVDWMKQSTRLFPRASEEESGSEDDEGGSEEDNSCSFLIDNNVTENNFVDIPSNEFWIDSDRDSCYSSSEGLDDSDDDGSASNDGIFSRLRTKMAQVAHGFRKVASRKKNGKTKIRRRRSTKKNRGFVDSSDETLGIKSWIDSDSAHLSECSSLGSVHSLPSSLCNSADNSIDKLSDDKQCASKRRHPLLFRFDDGNYSVGEKVFVYDSDHCLKCGTIASSVVTDFYFVELESGGIIEVLIDKILKEKIVTPIDTYLSQYASERYYSLLFRDEMRYYNTGDKVVVYNIAKDLHHGTIVKPHYINADTKYNLVRLESGVEIHVLPCDVFTESIYAMQNDGDDESISLDSLDDLFANEPGDESSPSSSSVYISNIDILPSGFRETKYEVEPPQRNLSMFVDVAATLNFGFAQFKLKRQPLGKLKFGRGTAKCQNHPDALDIDMPGIEKYGIEKSEALAAAQQIASHTGNIKAAVIFLANAAVPIKKITDVFGEDQLPWRKDDLPGLKSTYDGSPEEMIACCTVVEGLIQYFEGFSKFKKDYMTKGSPTYAPFLLRDGIPYELCNLKCKPERIFGYETGQGRKVRLMTYDNRVLYYTVETNEVMFCRKINRKKGRHITLSPRITMYSTKNFRHGHDLFGYANIPKMVFSKAKKVRGKFKCR